MKTPVRLRRAWLLALFIAGCASDEPDRVERRDCERLRDHLVQIRMDSVTADREEHRRIARAALGDDFVAACVADTSIEQLRCAMGAKDPDALIACNPEGTP